MGSKEKEQKKKGGEQSKEQQQEQRHGQSSNKKRKEVCPYGNYKAYYGYRIGGGELEEDPRLKVFKKEWFQGKDCLDIGCNSGIMTIQIAKKFCCQSILGVDIDNNRIEDAHWHLRKYQKMENTQKMPGKASKSDNANISEDDINGSLAEETKEMPTNSSKKDLSDIVLFKKEDFVNSRTPPGDFDTIICLSVTKWIQLNWGDDGLLTLFTKIWRLLRPGGTFVLEPQPWKSYEKNYKVSETAKTNYHNIMFRPDFFQDLLLDKIGFRTVENVTTSVSGSKTGFNRPILVFQK